MGICLFLVFCYLIYECFILYVNSFKKDNILKIVFDAFLVAVLQILLGMTLSHYVWRGKTVNKGQISSLNGHIIMAGKLNAQEYVCVDVLEALSRMDISDLSKKGLNFFKNLLEIPDVFCSGLDSVRIE